ncbi:hypothetical protein CONPUDRAFT_166613 [Coniophora puteana RWD-64-598 SS2]|uniref:Ribosomal RNA-processing protein 43 n=1 Tax=Coniophora puteana (strain RWD-64-598) TaxID=741705 RepID=A0A5M3MMN8_CONPW|nr:uncharacterized protein CONPUDRAFT_166613 [Coniophora puteana RWD-64-598 SS2]EIW79965.1 hypothetical protein CONPUDRAFT_166613 [Coniophora puteana RWD-64-598 SS2]
MATTAQAPEPPKDPQSEAIKAQIFQRLHPRSYLERYISEDVRPDGRGFEDWREVSVNVGSISTAHGSALVRMGDTRIVCGVKAEIAEPELDKPHEGFLVPNLDLPALCSPKFKPGPPAEEAQILSERLNEALVASGILPLESLAIHPGKAVWTIYIDAICLNFDGNAFDAALLAMVAALYNTRLPVATFDEDTGHTTCLRKETVPLELTCKPISTSFGMLDSLQVLSDPTSFEEPLMDTTVSVVVNEKGDLLAVNELGLGTMTTQKSGDLLKNCIEKSKLRVSNLVALI